MQNSYVQLQEYQVAETLALHKLWKQTNTKHGKRACFKDVRIVDYDFTKLNLSRAHFEHCELLGCTFDISNLNNTQFKDVEAEQCSFKASTFWNSIFRKIKMRDCDVNNAQFNCASITDTDLLNSNLKGANFTSVELINSQLKGTDCSFAQFNETIANKTRFDSVNFSGANTKTLQLNSSHLTNVIGNGKDIYTLQMGMWSCAMRPHKDEIYIGRGVTTLSGLIFICTNAEWIKEATSENKSVVDWMLRYRPVIEAAYHAIKNDPYGDANHVSF